jgi:hypothetical protein
VQLVVADDSSDGLRGGELYLFVDRPGATSSAPRKTPGKASTLLI